MRKVKAFVATGALLVAALVAGLAATASAHNTTTNVQGFLHQSADLCVWGSTEMGHYSTDVATVTTRELRTGGPVPPIPCGQARDMLPGNALVAFNLYDSSGSYCLTSGYFQNATTAPGVSVTYQHGNVHFWCPGTTAYGQSYHWAWDGTGWAGGGVHPSGSHSSAIFSLDEAPSVATSPRDAEPAMPLPARPDSNPADKVCVVTAQGDQILFDLERSEGVDASTGIAVERIHVVPSSESVAQHPDLPCPASPAKKNADR